MSEALSADKIEGPAIVETVAAMRAWSFAQRAAGRTIGFVPTMGYLHAGHTSLMKTARERADRVVVSIFVNPTQFGPNEDLARYPRDLARDTAMCREVGVDAIFFPPVAEMYPAGYQTQVTVPKLAAPLCGASRPVHFGGVATVCCKLFNIVLPHFAVFGQKDYQQLLVVSRMAADLNTGVEVVPGPTVREGDGLAMSSRNVYLTPQERAQAVAINRALRRATEMVAGGETSRDAILAMVREHLAAADLGKIDYVELRALPDLTEAEAEAHGDHLLAVAFQFSIARLIDNVVLPFPAAARASEGE